MGQPCNVSYNCIACDIASHCKGQLALGIAEVVALQDFPERNGVLVIVWHFNADGRLSGNRCFHSNALCRQGKGNVICKAGDLGNLDAGGRLNFVPCNRWASGNPGNADRNAEAVECIHQNTSIFLEFLLGGRISGTADAGL